MRPRLPRAAAGKPVSATDYNKLVDALEQALNITGRDLYIDSTGIHFRDPPQRPSLFPVKIEKTGGTDGTQTTKATWLYTVRGIEWDGANGSELGTDVEVVRPRPNGSMDFQADDQGYGMAFYDGGELKLWDAGEVPATGGCSS